MQQHTTLNLAQVAEAIDAYLATWPGTFSSRYRGARVVSLTAITTLSGAHIWLASVEPAEPTRVALAALPFGFDERTDRPMLLAQRSYRTADPTRRPARPRLVADAAPGPDNNAVPRSEVATALAKLLAAAQAHYQQHAAGFFPEALRLLLPALEDAIEDGRDPVARQNLAYLCSVLAVECVHQFPDVRPAYEAASRFLP